MATKASENDKAKEKEETFTRRDFFRDLKKVTKKRNRPSPPDPEKR